MCKFKTFLLLLVLSGIYAIPFKSAAQDNLKHEFGFTSDNDAYLFYGQDRYYTNGLFIYFRGATNAAALSDKLEKLTYELSAGQKMFNPRSGSIGIKSRQDRPFAGYLYAGGSVSWFFRNETVLKSGLELGTTGPNSLAEDAQKLLHKIAGFYTIDGWQYQIQNELSANATVQLTQLLHRSEQHKLDFSYNAYINAGTLFSGAGLGFVMRAGKINQLFASSYTQSLIAHKPKTAAYNKHECYFYLKPQLNYVAYDGTMQGSMFNNNSPVTFNPKPWVFAQQLGFNYSTKRFTFDYNIIFKSREVKSAALPHQYGSISMLYRFN